MSNLQFEERIISGGYTESLNRDILRARQWRKSYLRNITEREVPETFKIRNPELLYRVMDAVSRVIEKTNSGVEKAGLAKNNLHLNA